LHDPFLDYTRAFAQHARDGAGLAASLPPVRPLPVPCAQAPTCLVFSPHPDDEAISGALPWRLRSQWHWRVVNVAVTLGSKVQRRAARWEELRRSCTRLGFELVSASGEAGQGLHSIGPQTASEQPAHWLHCVQRVAALLQQYRPQVVVCPHAQDGHPVHIGTHLLVRDALARLDPHPGPHVLLSEYWNTQLQPGLMLELDARQVADLMAALCEHTGEVARNPYHLSLPAWFMDGVRRGAERVGAAGARAPGFGFAALYGWQRWQAGALHAQPPRIVPLDDALPALFAS